MGHEVRAVLVFLRAFFPSMNGGGIWTRVNTTDGNVNKSPETLDFFFFFSRKTGSRSFVFHLTLVSATPSTGSSPSKRTRQYAPCSWPSPYLKCCVQRLTLPTSRQCPRGGKMSTKLFHFWIAPISSSRLSLSLSRSPNHGSTPHIDDHLLSRGDFKFQDTGVRYN